MTTEIKKEEVKKEEAPIETPKENELDKLSSEELKAKAEALESEIKTLKESSKETEVKTNYLRRVEKAQEKLEALKNTPNEPDEPKKVDIETRDLITLGKHDIAEDSEEAKILKKYKDGGLIKNYAEGLEYPGVKAEFEALKAKNNAQAIIDENGSDEEARLKTTKEVIASYRSTGEVPTDPNARKAIAKENLKEMGI